MIFEQDPPYMSQESMHVLLNIIDRHASPKGTFVRMYNMEKVLHVLSRFSMDKLVMQEVAYHSSPGLLDGFNRKKAPCPMLPM